ncbi:MAG: hypothetical protein J6U10_03630, partial [Lachnospiraceae bacterium]|nr:hypothetical protein [Lachnospiraceae bacterium]
MAKRRKKQNDALYILVLTCLSALLFFAVVMGVTGIVGKIAGDPVPTFAPKPIEEAKEIQVVSADLVLVTDGAGGLYAAFLAELDCVNLYWRMNVIPLDTRLEISPTLYRECVKENVSTPQLTTIAELYKCLPGESAARLTLSA